MPQTLQQRADELEKKLAELLTKEQTTSPKKGAWQQTFGLSRDDPGA